MQTVTVVRQAVESDAQRLLELRRALFQETDLLLWEPDEFRDTVEDEAQRITRFNSVANSHCFVAENGRELIGFIFAVGGAPRRLRHSTSLALGERHSHWGRGVGSLLVKAALEWSQRSGLRRVELTVHTSNDRAVRLYERFGFEVEGVRRSSLLVNGSFKDEYQMSLINDV
jgi:RimJ/RimL family protein N-acetyltransferase